MAKIDVIETSRPGADGLFNEEQVKAIAADAIADDETVVAAAVAAVADQDIPGQVTDAVDADIAGRELVEAVDVPSDINRGIIWCAGVDDNGNLLWAEAGPDGLPTPRTALIITEAIQDMVAVAVGQLLGIETMNPEITGLIWALVDDDENLLLEFGLDGKLSDRVITQIGTKLLDFGLIPTPVPNRYLDTNNVSHSIASGLEIVGWGDSMTAGAGGGGTTYLSVLATLSGLTVHNRGVGGETSVTIAARSGATPMLVLPVGGSIPTSGAVDLTIRPINGQTPAPLVQGGSGQPYATGSIAGVPGTLSLVSGTYKFTRTTSGSAVPVTRPVPYLDTESPLRRGDLCVIWIGQNGPNHTRAKADVAAILHHRTTLDNGGFLIIPRPTSTPTEDAEWHDLYGRRVILARQYLVEYGLADAGITPTSQDTIDMAAGTVPTSLRVDSVHWTAAGYTILGNLVYDRFRELGDL